MKRQNLKGLLGVVAILLICGGAPLYAQANNGGNGASTKAATPPTPASASKPTPAPTPTPAPRPAASAEEETLDPAGLRLDAARNALDQIDAQLAKDNVSDADLLKLRVQIDPLTTQIQAVITETTPRQVAIKARIDQLGAPPDPKATPTPAPEDPAITDMRSEQLKQFAAEDELIKRAKLQSVRADQLAAQIAERRRAIFTNALFQTSSSILSPSLWYDVIGETPTDFVASRVAVVGFFRDAVQQLGGRSAMLLAAMQLAILALFITLSRWARRIIPREPANRSPTEFQKAAAALWVGFKIAAIPIAGLSAMFGAAVWFGLDDQPVHPIVRAIYLGAVRCALVAGVGAALLAPMRPNWRPVDLTDRIAQRIWSLSLWVSVLIAFGKIFEAKNEVINASLQASVATRGLMALLVGLALARGLYGIAAGPEASADGAARMAHLEDESPFWAPIRFTIWTATFAIIGATLIGYIALAAFLVDQVAWISFVCSLFFLLAKLINEGGEYLFRPGSRLSRSLTSSLGLRRERLQQIGVLLSGALYVALSGMLALLILVPWGLQSHDLVGTIKSAFFGVQVGDMTISLSSLLTAIVLFSIGYGLTHAVQSWLETRYLPLTQLDTGLRASIRTSIGYIGFMLSLGFAVSYLGLNLERLALVAGALSVGIGLGLQSVVNNFVSGLILLWERAIRVGDLIVVGDEQGYVRRINVRATEIETFDRATMIVPNGNMVTGVVKNFVRGDRVGRIKISLQVVQDCDPEQVRQLLIETAREHEQVVSFPAPVVLFSSFSPAALNFDLLCFVEDIEIAGRVKSDLHFAIFKTFKEAGVQMPPPPAPSATTMTLDLSQLEPLLQKHLGAAAFKPNETQT